MIEYAREKHARQHSTQVALVLVRMYWQNVRRNSAKNYVEQLVLCGLPTGSVIELRHLHPPAIDRDILFVHRGTGRYYPAFRYDLGKATKHAKHHNRH